MASNPPAAFVAAVRIPLAGPAADGANLNVKVQLALAARVAPHVVVSVKGLVRVTCERFSVPLPEFVTVATCAGLVVPIACNPKLMFGGVKVAMGIWTPLPAKFTVKFCPPGAFVTIVNVPVRGPACLGANVIVYAQLDDAAIAVWQVLVCAKSPVRLADVTCTPAFPTFRSVTISVVRNVD